MPDPLSRQRSADVAAVLLVKRLSPQIGKPFVPLRSAGLAPFCAALQDPLLCHASE